MVKVIGKGVFALKTWLNNCEQTGGTLIIRTGFSGWEYTDRIVAACFQPNKRFRGGQFDHLSNSLVEAIKRAKRRAKKRKLTFAMMRAITNKFV